MRNPALRLVGIAASPGGGGVFGTRAEEELRLWLESRLDALGIDPVAYSRFVLSLLRRPDSALSPLDDEIGRSGGRRRIRSRAHLQGDREQRRAVVQCLTNAADQKCLGVESLVDELCAKLRDLEGSEANEKEEEECRKIEGEPKSNFEALTPRDRALRYYAAFPALQPTTPKRNIHRKDKNFGAANNKNRNIGLTTATTNKNNNNNKNHNNNNNHKNHKNKNSDNFNAKGKKKTKMSIVAFETRHMDEKETFGFAKSMEKEREREQERELELDKLRLAELQAKFNESLEALWDSGPGINQDKASIWAAPSLSIPSGPLWPVDPGEVSLILPINDSVSTVDTPYQESIDDSPIIPWDIDLIGVGKYTDESCEKDKIGYNLSWSEYGGDGPWNWKELGNNLINMDKSPKDKNFFPIAQPKTPKNEVDADLKMESQEEDLLTSARTHFRPIKDDGHWADGTTFPVNNHLEKITYRRSESGNLLYLPGDENPYMEFRDTPSPSANFTLKFRVRQCDKGIQTDPVRSPVKRRILAEADHIYYSVHDDDVLIADEEDDKDFIINQMPWIQPSLSLLNDRKRRHSSSFNCRPLTALRPLTL
ncbi:uncharacterized protein [Chelonus insularis]|uniref:uncharacterized protein isoform X2 n=1 Tax=Chelonus insularis TaxID=460826 RepID=UPI00158CAA3D|nr:uncharacterized protein LOC118072968 isoform X2 [Chelonus insularis]